MECLQWLKTPSPGRVPEGPEGESGRSPGRYLYVLSEFTWDMNIFPRKRSQSGDEIYQKPPISLDVFSTFGGQLRTESTNALVNLGETHW